jgi:regulator of cell morphogenesis and NO signaling
MLKKITTDSLVTDIVTGNYRTAEVFSKYDIDFCSANKMSLIKACELKGLNQTALMQELQQFSSAYQNADQWSVDFLIDYLMNVHHNYFKNNITLVQDYINKFIDGHPLTSRYFEQLPAITQKLYNRLTDLRNYETTNLFPYVKRLNYAYNNNEVYGKLFIKTLRKLSVEDLEHFHAQIEIFMAQVDHLTKNFILPDDACPAQKIMIEKLQEFVDYIKQHFLMEKKILLPAILRMEKSLLEKYTDI